MWSITTRRILKDKDAMLEVARLAAEDQRKVMSECCQNCSVQLEDDKPTVSCEHCKCHNAKSEAAEWERRAKQYRDTLYGKQHMLYIGEKQDYGQLCEAMRNACDAIDALIENATHQRQQAYEQGVKDADAEGAYHSGYLAGLADCTGKPPLAIEQARQQAVAEFAREAVERSLNSVVNGKVVRLADIRTLLEQRGINLD